MKKIVISTLFCVIALVNINAQDAPNPPANLQTLPTGSYVIAMDNTWQNIATVGVYDKFNLKTYGLIIHLLNNNVKLKWVIRSGKIKDAIDFTVNAEMVKPSFIATASRNFKGGPFVIYSSDTTGLSSLINSYYTSQGLTGNLRPNVFRTTAPETVDIRYSYNGFKPKAAIMTDGGNENIHRDYFIASGITIQNYSILGAVDLSSCFSFASEPHNSKSGAIVDSTVSNIRRFVLTGRNFLAQCAAVRTYENSSFGRFQSTLGFSDDNFNIGTNVLYPYADLAYYQFEGTYNASSGGSLKNWTLNPGSVPQSTTFNKAVSAVDTFSQAITMSKLVSGPGGLVFYLGNHDFSSNNESGISGIRMYMSAFLIPTQLPEQCAVAPLPVKLTSFQGNLNNNKVNLMWTVADNEIADKFEVEKSVDGINFNTAALVFGSEKSGSEKYLYNETMKTERIFYRLRMTDKSQVVTYSKVLMFQTSGTLSDNTVNILNNPATDRLSFSFGLMNNQQTEIRIIDLTGRVRMKQLVTGVQGNNNISIQLASTLQYGMYILEVVAGTEHYTAKFIKQ